VAPGRRSIPVGRAETKDTGGLVATVLERQIVKIGGDDKSLVARLAEPLKRALSGRRSFYAVHIETVGRVGEVMVSIDGHSGRLPLLFRLEDMDTGYVCTVVKDAVRRLDF
jgi:hypothetical protein